MTKRLGFEHVEAVVGNGNISETVKSRPLLELLALRYPHVTFDSKALNTVRS